MDLLLQRFSDNGNSTLGLFYINNKFEAFTMEDEHRESKVAGETCIPTGKYKVVFQENVTGLTQKYRNKYTWFDKHLMLEGDGDFQLHWTSVYIHIGNYESNSAGCILLANGANSNVTGTDGSITDSKNCFKRIYPMICDVLEEGKKEVNLIVTGTFV